MPYPTANNHSPEEGRTPEQRRRIQSIEDYHIAERAYNISDLSDKGHPRIKKLKKAVAILALAATTAIGVGVYENLPSTKKQNHIQAEYDAFNKYGLANSPEQLIIEAEHKAGVAHGDETVITVKAGELTAEQVAKDNGIYNWAEVGDNVISPQVNDPKSKGRFTMHGGEKAIVPNNLFEK